MGSEVDWKLSENRGPEGCGHWYKVQLGASHKQCTKGSVLDPASSLMTGAMEQNTPSASLQMMQKWEEHQMVVLLFKATWIVWETGKRQLSRHSTRVNHKSCSWGEISLYGYACWGLTTRKADMWKTFLDPGGQLAISCKKDQQPSGLHWAERCQQVWGGDPSPQPWCGCIWGVLSTVSICTH